MPFYTLKSRGRIISQQRVQMILAMEIDLIYFTFILAHYHCCIYYQTQHRKGNASPVKLHLPIPYAHKNMPLFVNALLSYSISIASALCNLHIVFFISMTAISMMRLRFCQNEFAKSSYLEKYKSYKETKCTVIKAFQN